jgi:hypothetical protein
MTVSLTWFANPLSSPVTQYQLRAGSGPGLSNLAIVNLPGNQNAFSANAPPGTYYVRVVAINAFGASPPSNEVVITVTGGGCLVPGTPTGLSATPGAGSVTIRWNAPTTGGAPTGYGLIVGSAPGATDLGTYLLGQTLFLTSPAPPGQYYIRVFASNACGNSPPTAEVSFVIGTAPPPAGDLPAGRYQGIMSNHTNVTAPRRLSIRNFSLVLNQDVPAGPLQPLSATWADDAGCVQSTGILGGRGPSGPVIVIQGLPCNGGGSDLGLQITSFDGQLFYDGVCPLGGPNCTFRLLRRDR